MTIAWVGVAATWAVTVPGMLRARSIALQHRVPDWRFERLGMLVWDYSGCPRRRTVCHCCGEFFEGENAYDEWVTYCWLLGLVTGLAIFVEVCT